MAETGEKKFTRRDFLKMSGGATLAAILVACDQAAERLGLTAPRFGERLSDEPVRIYVANWDPRVAPEDRGWVNVREKPTVIESEIVGRAIANNPELAFFAFRVIGSPVGARPVKDPETGQDAGLWYFATQIPGVTRENPEKQVRLTGYVSSIHTVGVSPPEAEKSS